MATKTIADAGGVWTDDTTWVEGAKPTAADDVVATATSGNVSITSAAVCRSIDLTGYTGTLTQASSLTVGDASGGSLKFVSGMGWTYTSGNLVFASTTTGNTITTAGKTLGAVVVNGVGGGWTLQDSLTCSTDLTLQAGALVFGAQSVQCRTFVTSTSGVKSLTASGTITLTHTSTATVWNLGGSNVTLTMTGSIIVIATSSANTRTFAGGSKTYGNLTFSNPSTGGLTITGTNTFATLTVSTTSTGSAKTITFPITVTTTITSLVLSGRAGNLLSVFSSSSGTAAVISVAAGNVTGQYLNIRDITAQGGATFRAVNSTDVSGNTGWTFLNHLSTALADIQKTVLDALYPDLSLSDQLMEYWSDNGGLRTNDALVTYYGGPNPHKSLNDLAYDFWLSLT